MLNGYKTYIIGLLAIAAGIYLESINAGTGYELITIGLVSMGLRHGVAKVQDAAESPTIFIKEVEVPAKKATKAKTKKSK